MAETTMTPELQAALDEIARLKADLATKHSGPRPSLKVSDKGGISLYGLGRFPVTLYKEQWLKVLAMEEEIKDFIEDNDSKLAVKPPKS